MSDFSKGQWVRIKGTEITGKAFKAPGPGYRVVADDRSEYIVPPEALEATTPRVVEPTELASVVEVTGSRYVLVARFGEPKWRPTMPVALGPTFFSWAELEAQGPIRVLFVPGRPWLVIDADGDGWSWGDDGRYGPGYYHHGPADLYRQDLASLVRDFGPLRGDVIS